MKQNFLKHSLDSISVILFFILIIYLPDIDILTSLESIGINTTFKLTIVLVLLISLAMSTYCYSKITGSIIFACTSLFLRTQFKYVEAYQNSKILRLRTYNNLPKNMIKSENDNIQKVELTVEEYLLKQISDDPNRTNLEKQIIKDITQKYFLNSDNLKKLTDFNEESEKNNIAAN